MGSALRHPNVLSLQGATMTDTQFMMVSEWMPNGNINEFVRKHPDADRFELVGFLLEAPLSQLVDGRPTSLVERCR